MKILHKQSTTFIW